MSGSAKSSTREYQRKVKELVESLKKVTGQDGEIQQTKAEELSAVILQYSEDVEKIHKDCSKILRLFGISSATTDEGNDWDTHTVQDQLDRIYTEVLKLQGGNQELRKLVLPESVGATGKGGLVERLANQIEVVYGDKQDVANGSVDECSHNPAEIRGLTTEDEDQRLIHEQQFLQASVFPLQKGDLFVGKAISEISKLIPTDPSVVISVANYLNGPLDFPVSYHLSDSSRIVGSLAKVEAKTAEFVCVQDTSKGRERISGQLGYIILNTELKLFINFSVSAGDRTYIGLSLGSARIPVGEEARDFIWHKTNFDTFRPDTRSSGDKGHGGQVIISNGTLRAWGEITHSTKAIMRVMIWSEEVVRALNSPMRTLMEKRKPEHDENVSMFGQVRNPFACKIILENRLRVELIEGCWSFTGGTAVEEFWNTLRPSQMDSVLVSGSSLVKGLVCYKIASTDIKVVLGFWTTLSKSYFCISFLSEAVTVDQVLMNKLAETTNDFSGPLTKVASSLEGEQRIQIRNIVATALISDARYTMSSRHSLLKVSIQVQQPSSV